jgi:hypothetical protein
MNIDLITYGNPNIDQVEKLKNENYLDFLFEELFGISVRLTKYS